MAFPIAYGAPKRLALLMQAEALLTLKHRLEITGPRTLQITFTGTDVNLQGDPR